ncbi:MAG TPA: hypothetical protein V6D27_05765, partial [Vampirovibrionales bacterium]
MVTVLDVYQRLQPMVCSKTEPLCFPGVAIAAVTWAQANFFHAPFRLLGRAIALTGREPHWGRVEVWATASSFNRFWLTWKSGLIKIARSFGFD